MNTLFLIKDDILNTMVETMQESLKLALWDVDQSLPGKGIKKKH